MIRMMAIAAAVALLAQAPNNVRDELAALRNEAHTRRAAGDHAGYLQEAVKARELLNNNPNAILSVARGYMEAGKSEKALDALVQFADLGQVDTGMLDGSNKDFASLVESPRYKDVLKRFEENKKTVSGTQIQFDLPDPGLVAEDIDYDPSSRAFLVTSVLEKKIIRVTEKGAATDFASSPSGWPMLAIKVDGVRNLVWATEAALDGFTVAPKSDWGRSAVVCFDLKSGKLLHRFEGPAGSALGDMALDQEGDPLVSDGERGGVYRLKHGQLRLLNGTDFISPQTPAVLPDGKHALVPDYLRGIAVLDLEVGSVRWLLSNGTALSGVDGMYYDRGMLLLIQNGTSPERVIRAFLDTSLQHVVRSYVIEQNTPTLGDPTHCLSVGNDYFYIANSGWSELDDHGNVKAGSKLTPAHVMRFRSW
ncbi:hypothetical protein [Occallatibacter savannae]|uniref:hypothetical protein n=1 Tax=Occallatibacter savannae TaxID=1002691 RepID=UPI0013A591BB|nr:hypothetical protein [Occallatibacter savannae]